MRLDGKIGVLSGGGTIDPALVAEVLADRVLVLEEASNESFVDDGHMQRRLGVLLGDAAPRDDFGPDIFEIPPPSLQLKHSPDRLPSACFRPHANKLADNTACEFVHQPYPCTNACRMNFWYLSAPHASG